MGWRNKLLIEIAGRPIIAHTVDAVIDSKATDVIVVTGYQRSRLEHALHGKRVRFVHNANYRHGLSSSLRCGLATLGPHCAAALICLGDMPLVTSRDIDRLISAFQQLPQPEVCACTFAGARGHPVILPRAILPDLAGLQGDVGAQQWIARNSNRLHGVNMKTDAVLADIDSPRSLHRLRDAIQLYKLKHV